jgi:two-component system, NtrC family, response regulator PilR
VSPRIVIAGRTDGWAPILRYELIGEGYEVTVVETFDQMRSLLANGSFDLAIPTNDDKSKGEGIHELTAELRAKHPNLAIIIMTGYSSLDEAIKSKRHGADDFIGLPFDLEDVIQTFRRVLNERKVVTHSRST